MKKAVRAIGKGVLAALLGVILLLSLAAIVIAIVFSCLNRTNGEIYCAGRRRTYLLYVPETYDAATATPLVICLHGFAQWPAHQMEMTGWNELADQFGFIVVYPAGTGFPLRWNAGGELGTANDPLFDVIFLSDLIDSLQNEYNIDEARIYANGLSNGAGMSHMLACKLSDRIAAVGTVAGAYSLPWSECTPSRPVPVIAFHGTADPIVPYGGGRSRSPDLPLPAVEDWAATWAERNGCGDAPLELPSSGEVSAIRYTDCNKGADVVLYTVQGGGHTWPGGAPLPEWLAGHTTSDIDATEEMWEFFVQHPLAEDQ
jgi:polyhydroxybutyrate depolymerase